MDDTATIEEQPTGTEQQPTDSRHFAKLKADLAAAEERAARYRDAALANAIKVAGFDPANGHTKLVVEKFNAEPDLDPTPEAFTEFAGNWGLAPNQPTGGGTATETDKPDLAQLLTERQQTGDDLRAASTTTAPADIDEQIAEAERSGDVARAIALKNEKFGLGRPTAPASP